ncbi:uncharacterized protein [Zea mays]|uniref:uncharacterized protein isoform X2 n=1 Tax=Zea mays TaxID=4577 RepID=UPI0009AAD3BD|nr:uncharacterized protein LOC103633571 isoform X2 [Zea mays]XP_020396985.1 uncharacterized protein LOC103633571 isoform X2 [Zea mays]|eukprot:XP_020396983.1 uncharacterized protein LOC103633571 isoform X2 [Zea mays]
MPVENRESWKEYQVFSISYLIFLFEIIVGAKVFWYPQVAHIPGALFFDLDGIVDRTTDARQIVGSAVLVKARDRPEIEDDEFYSLDLYCQGYRQARRNSWSGFQFRRWRSSTEKCGLHLRRGYLSSILVLTRDRRKKGMRWLGLHHPFLASMLASTAMICILKEIKNVSGP